MGWWENNFAKTSQGNKKVQILLSLSTNTRKILWGTNSYWLIDYNLLLNQTCNSPAVQNILPANVGKTVQLPAAGV